MKKVYFYLMVLVLFAVSMTTKAQYEVRLIQEPTNDYSNVTTTLDLTKVASDLGLTTDALQRKLAQDGTVEIMQADGQYVNGTTTSESNGYWMTEEGNRTSYQDHSAWFLFVTTDDNDLSIHAGQYPNTFADLNENKTLSTTISIHENGKRAIIDVYFTIKVKEEASSGWTCPIPNFIPMADDGETIQYLYNVEYGGFFCGANEWGTRASVSKTNGFKVKIHNYADMWNDEQTTWGIEDSVETKNQWKLTFCVNSSQIWVDSESETDNRTQWVLTSLGDNKYEITNAAVGDSKLKMGVTQYYDGLVGNTRLWLIDPSILDTQGDPIMSGEAYTTWAFVSPAEYERWRNKALKYEIAVELGDLITTSEARYDGIDLSIPKAVYNNTFSSLSELEEALELAKETIMRIRYGNMEEGEDCTAMLVNPSFTDGFNGWTNNGGTVGGLKAFPNVECWQKIVECSQTVRGVPAGLYAISVKAFERPDYNGNFDINAPSKVSLFMNGFQTPVQNILQDALPQAKAENFVNCYIEGEQPSEDYYDTGGTTNNDYLATEGYIPNGMSGASYAFRAGRYEQHCYGLVSDDGIMKIGLTSNGETCHWVLWADFKLTYMAKNTEAVLSVLDAMSEPFEKYVTENKENMNALAVNATNEMLTTISSAKDKQEGDAMWDALISLNAAFPAARANVAAMTAYKEVAGMMADINESIVAAAPENIQQAYEIAVAQMGNIDNMTTEEITVLAQELRTIITKLEFLVIETAQAGELGDLVLDHVENFSDVKKLKVVGPINSKDMENIHRMTNATEIDLGDATGLATLSSSTFSENNVLERIILPKSLTNIESGAFQSCKSLRYAYLPGSLADKIGSSAFYSCTQLESVELGEGISIIPSYMFEGCYRLKTVIMPSTLRTIQYQAFYNCYQLTNFTLPEGLATINEEAFYRNTINASVRINTYYDENGNYQEVYVNNVSPQVLQFPSTLTTIGNRAFTNWRDLTSVQLNEGLTSIGYDAFAGNNVTNVTLPGTLSRISYNIFTSESITVTSLAIIPPKETSTSSCPVRYPDILRVPNIALKAYKQAVGWDRFNIVGFDYIPNDIVIHGELTLEMNEGAFENAKPNVWMAQDSQNTSASNAKYGEFTIKGGETLSMGIFNMIADPNAYGSDWSNYRNYKHYTTLVSNATMRADSVNTRLYIRNNKWNFLSFPYDTKVSDIKDVFGGAQWVIRKYDGQKRADADMENTWENVKKDDILEAHKGYIWQMGQRGSEEWGGFDIPAINNSNKNNIFANDDVEVALDEFGSEYAHNRSWNLIGNPYPCYYDTRAMEFAAPITVWNYYYQNYEAYSPVDDNYILAPYEAFFVQRPVDQESIIFTKEGRQHSQTVDANASYGAKMRDAAAYSARSVFNLTLSNGEMSDRTRVVFNEDAIMDYELDKDASKFMANTEIPQLFSLDKDVRYAINERPFDKGSVCLGYKVAANGTYTIAVNTKAKGAVMLEDTETGEVMNLSENAYSFSATAGTNESRFILHFSGEDATSIHSLDIAGKTNISELYTLDGRRLNGTVTTGVYLMKKGQTFQKVFVK